MENKSDFHYAAGKNAGRIKSTVPIHWGKTSQGGKVLWEGSEHKWLGEILMTITFVQVVKLWRLHSIR